MGMCVHTYIYTHIYTHILISVYKHMLSVGGYIKVYKNTQGNKSCLPRIGEIFLC